MARVDALPEGAKDVLQTGSVIEREFSHELIQKVTDLPERELLSHVAVLKDAELLYERGLYPHAAYVFKHALTREVLYDSGRIPSPSAPGAPVGATTDNLITSFEINYCTYEVSPDITIAFYESHDACDGVPTTTLASFTPLGLPGSAASNRNVARVVGSKARPAQLGDAVLGPALHAETRKSIARAESGVQGLTLLLASPEFQRR